MAKRNIRTSQLVVPFSVGQIINFLNDESLMLGGLHLWDQQFEVAGDERENYNLNKFIINEPRLQRLLNVSHFRKPFPFLERNIINRGINMPAVRFPGWHYCLKCGRMWKKTLIQDNNFCSEDCGGKLIPVRFIAACPLGHIQDVPFMEWVHRGNSFTEKCKFLTYNAKSGAGDLASIKIKCSCGKVRSLAGIMNEHALARIGLAKDEELDNTERNPEGQYCRGERPWLGLEGDQHRIDCSQELRVLIRGASNVHYSHIASAIYLPENESLSLVADNFINKHGKEKINSWLNQDNAGYMLKAILGADDNVTNSNIDVDILFEEIVQYVNAFNEEEDNPQTEIDNLQIKLEEYEVFNKGFNTETKELKAIVKDISYYVDKEFIERYFERVTLIEKLKETKVFTGFSRIDSNDGRTLEQRKRDLTIGDVSWLPAMEVYGEGIFLKFKNELIDEWLKEVGSSFDSLINRYREARDGANRNRDINPAFIMMHTFAHLLIKRLCYSCGYGSSALRERIYFSSEKETRMNGILIYTSSGDSEGSMGGLVRQGKEQFLAKNIIDALLDAEWCSADPVCSDIGRLAGQGPDSVNGAACHNCVIVPETSCEEYNCLLDRATVITLNEGKVKGFFNIETL
jgi:hypothetical protein